MRLLNTKSRKLSYFNDLDAPPYVILSHTWGDEEVSFQDISGSESFLDSKGYQKIDGCCRRAIADGYEYVWIDTCCIDKTSSAELSEAINSMFWWYMKADVCYAFLYDVNTEENISLKSQLARSRWFTRGWTLQELIAPSEVVFYDSQWVEIGTKLSLCVQLSRITSINARLLSSSSHHQDGVGCEEYSVACRMSWASKRITTRIEDTAYCLMGIFGVNMPLLYGEGEKAFQRLQEEIMKNSDDHSLFAWTSQTMRCSGLLAPSPREFSKSGNIEQIPDNSSPPFSITNKGVQVTLPLLKNTSAFFIRPRLLAFVKLTYVGKSRVVRKSEFEYDLTNSKLALLNCQLSDAPGQRLALALHKPQDRRAYLRNSLSTHVVSPGNFSMLQNTEVETIFIQSSSLLERQCHLRTPPARRDECWCIVKTLTLGFHIDDEYPENAWSKTRADLCLNMHPVKHCASLLFRDYLGKAFAVVFQHRNGLFNVGVISCLGFEDKLKIIGRCHKLLEPQDRVTHKLSENMEVLASIKKCPGGRVAHISIRSNLLN